MTKPTCYTARSPLARPPENRHEAPRLGPLCVTTGRANGRDATRRFLSALNRSAAACSLEVRFGVTSGMAQRFHRAAALERVAETILQSHATDGPPGRSSSSEGYGT